MRHFDRPPIRISPLRFLAWVTLTIALPTSAAAAVIGGTFEISGAGCRFPDAAFGGQDGSGSFLVVWADYNETRVHGRLVSGDGVPRGAPFPISEAPYGALFPAVAHGAASDEFLVTWDDFGGRGDVIHGQRVRAADGALIGKNFRIGSVPGGIRSAVASSAASGLYLVVYWVPGAAAEVYGQRVSAAGALLGANFDISLDGVFSGYPAIAWGEAGDQFLVTWDSEDGSIHGRRVGAAQGDLLGTPILVTPPGARDRSCIAHDPLNRRWLVQYNDGGNPGFSYDQWGRLVAADGGLLGEAIPIAHSPQFEGDTQFGGDIAFAPGAERFFSSFGTDSGMGGQESDASGAPAAPPATLGTGYYTSLNNAADTARNRFLTVWEGQVGGSFQVFGRLYAASIGTVGELSAEPGDARVTLRWRNPLDPQFAATVIRFKTDGYPAGPADGEALADRPGPPGSTDAFTHQGLSNGTTYYYSAFARDDAPNHSPPARAAATPRQEPVTVVHHSSFDAGSDGWSLETWKSGPSSPGTIDWDAVAGNVVTTGSGQTNNLDSCTREGGTLIRGISTAGRRSLQIEYDVEAALYAPPGPSAGGTCAVLEGGVEDKLVVSVSTTGIGGPWMVVEVLTEGAELPCGWTRKLINLAGVQGVDDNPGFALRFEWQFNHALDSGRLDDIRLLSGAATGPLPAIGISPPLIERFIEVGRTPPSAWFWVENTGEGVLDFTMREDVPWLSVSPARASSAGPPKRVALGFSGGGLEPGEHRAEVQVSASDDLAEARALTVVVNVAPPACLRERFEYYDGPLETMGQASWSGNAAGALAVQGGRLRITGGGGAVSATRAASCSASSKGVLAVEARIQKGPGTGEFFWNLAFDDDAGSTLARFYGGNHIARGRIGGRVTPDMPLTGEWDQLHASIDTRGRTTEFFFNGVSFGVIPHGAATTARLGSIRIERLDRVGAEAGAVSLDDLVVEAVSSSPFHRGDPDSSGACDLSDVISVLGYLFLQLPGPACAESADANDDGRIDIGDALAVLFYLYAAGPPPPAPGPPGSPCGEDPGIHAGGAVLGCERYAPCGG